MSKKAFSTILLCYLCLAPINWLPFIPITIVNLLKYSLFSILFLSCIFKKSKFKKVESFFTLQFYMLLLLCEAPAILHSKTGIITNIIDITFLFLMNYVIIQSSLTKDELFSVFYKVSLFIGCICLLSFVSAITGITINAPPPWNDPFSKSAFGGYRTGWSNSAFLFVPLLFYFYFFSSKKNLKIPALFAIIGIIISQVLSGGRAGLVGSLLTFLFFTRFKIQNVLILGFAIFMVYNYLGALNIEEYFRASESQIENKEGASNLDKISSGRVGVYEIGWKLFKKSPITGNGFSSITFETDGPDIHNTLFKRLVDGGLIFVAPVIFLFFSVYHKVIEKTTRYYNGSNHRVLFRALFVSSIFVSMLEPNYLIGSFQGEAFFWALVCTYLK